MVNLTPRYDSTTGASCTGSDGDANRTFTLTFSNYYSVIEILKQGAPLHESVDFAIANNVITFYVNVWNTDILSLRYFTSDSSTIITSGYGYVLTTDVYRTAGISSTEVSSADVTQQILRAEVAVCRLTKNIYWNIIQSNQAVASATNNSLTKTAAGWTVNDLTGLYVWIYSGTGSHEVRKIESNTTDTITVDRNWTLNPDNTSKFKIFYVPSDFDPCISDNYDGNGQIYMYLPYYPVKVVESLVIGTSSPVTVTPSKLYLYEKTGEIRLKPAAEVQVFSNIYPQEIDVSYVYGVDYLPSDVKRLVELKAAIQVLGQQMGGTFDKPSSVGLPELTITVGQASVNIQNTIKSLQAEYDQIVSQIKIWPVFG